MRDSRALMVDGVASSLGKRLIVAAICPLFPRHGAGDLAIALAALDEAGAVHRRDVLVTGMSGGER